MRNPYHEVDIFMFGIQYISDNLYSHDYQNDIRKKDIIHFIDTNIITIKTIIILTRK